jgi:hypothetical protein
MQRPGLLKLLLDFVRGLVARTQHHSADETMDFRRIFQASRQHALHPFAGLLGGAPDGVAAGMAENAAILRVAHQQSVIDILPREIRAHVELARISRRRDPLRHSEKP